MDCANILFFMVKLHLFQGICISYSLVKGFWPKFSPCIWQEKVFSPPGFLNFTVATKSYSETEPKILQRATEIVHLSLLPFRSFVNERKHCTVKNFFEPASRKGGDYNL